jgi:hypothetical protein
VSNFSVARQQQTYRPESPYSHSEIHVAKMSLHQSTLIES